jgi:hypothetical protein
LRNAKLRLDGVDLRHWISGRKISGPALTSRKFEVCLTAGKRTRGGRDLTLPLKFALWVEDDDPYRKLDVVRPLSLGVNLEPIGPVGRYWSLWMLLFSALILALLMAFLRNAIGFPGDFRTALAEGVKPSAPPKPRALGSAPFWQGLSRRQIRRPAISLTGHVLGHVVACDDDLYNFQPSAGFAEVTEEDERGGRLLPRQADGSVLMSAHRLYRIRGEGAVHHFRLEFEPPSTQP